MNYNTYDIDKLIESCNELHKYVANYGNITGNDGICKKFIQQLIEFNQHNSFMTNDYAPKSILDWFIGPNNQAWNKSDVNTISTILKQIKEENYVIVKEKVNEFDFWQLIHSQIANVCIKRFNDGHYADAVESAMKEVNLRVKGICKRYNNEEKDGVQLMQNVFSLNNPLLKFEDMSTASGKNIQQGYMQLFAGSIQALRNPKAHANLYISKESAMKQLIVASLLMDKIDEALLFTGINE